jgi:hypothetical protein
MMNKTNRRLAACLLALASALAPAAAAPPMDAAQRAEVIDVMSRELLAQYVFPAKAQLAIDAVREHQRNGDYDATSDGEAFAGMLTAHMQGPIQDKHFKIVYSAAPIPVPAAPAAAAPSAEPEPEPEKPAAPTFEPADCTPGKVRYSSIGKTECLPGNIGYFEMYAFDRMTQSRAVIAAAMSRLADTDALIIDLRANTGGDPATVELLSSYLFDGKTHLSDIYWRRSDSTVQSWTSDDLEGRRYGQKKAVYILTSSRTFSAAEGFSYSLKHLKRALVVGANTRGGANPGRSVRLNSHFRANISTGHVTSPVTGANWEGVGVLPDVVVEEHEALATAQILALEKLQKTRRDAASRALLRHRLAELKSGKGD